MPHRSRLLVAVVVLVCGLPAVPSRSATVDPFARADTLSAHGDVPGAVAVLDSLERVGAARGDGPLVIRANLARGTLRIDLGDARAEPDLSRAARLSRAAGDSVSLRRSLGWLGTAFMYQGRIPEALATYEEAIRMGAAAGDGVTESWARSGWSYCRLLTGDVAGARQGYEAALAGFRRIRDSYGELTALVGLGIADLQLGEFASAAARNREVLERSRALGAAGTEAQAWNNLGAIEFQQGDPAVAIEHYRRAIEVHAARGERREILTSRHNVAVALMELGRWDDAAAMLDSALADCEGRGLRETRARLLHQLAHLRVLQGRAAEALSTARRALEDSDDLPVELRARAMGDEARALLALERAAEATALLEGRAGPLRARLGVRDRVELDVVRAEALIAVGKPLAALERLRAADADAARAGMVAHRLRPLAAAARCQLAVADTLGARATLLEAARVWEQQRSVPADPEWRAERGARGREVFARLARLELVLAGRDEARIREVFDAVQHFQGRTLAERILGVRPASADSVRGITAARLQRDALRPGDLLLDVFVGPEASVLFAVTRNRCRAVVLPGEDRLAPRLRDLHELLAAPGGADARTLVASAGRATGEWLLGGVRDLVIDSRRILFVPDGPLHRVPLAVLELRSGDGWTRLADRELAVLPSAAMLELQRRDPRPIGPGGANVRVLDGSVVAGRALPGAGRERDALSAGYENVTVAPAGSPEAGLATATVVHVAGHAEVDDQRPWRSAFVLGVDAEGQPVRLSAADVALRRLDARLAVLAACRSGGGRVLSGEGVQGLTAAFLGAGVPCVVASLWPVDDAATERLMSAFYAALARGRTAGAALAEAQRRVRGRPATAHPFYWAGFVVVGDPDVTVPLRARRPAWTWVALAGGLVAGIVGWAASRRPRGPAAPAL